MRRSVLLGLVLIPSLSLGAQTRGSVIGGFVSAKMSAQSGGTTVTSDSRSGFAVGVGLTREFEQNYAVAPEFLYVQKGLHQAAQGDEAAIKLAYVEVPVLFRAMFASGEARPYVFGGPEVAFKVSCATSVTLSGTTTNGDCTDLSTGQSGVKSLDYGVVIGAGIAYRNLTASARYDVGLANIAKNSGVGESLKNRAWFFLGSIAVK